MKRILIKVGVALVIAAGIAAATTAYAFRGGPQAFMSRHVSAMVADALDAIKATPDQRAKVEAIKSQTMLAMQGLHGDHGAQLTEATQLFEADKIDASRVAAIKAEHTARMRQAGDVMVAAATQVHDLLTPAQRQQLVDFARARHASHSEWRGNMMQRMVSNRIDDALDTVKATPEQRNAILAARDHVFASFTANHPTDGAAELNEALAVFAADKIDTVQVEALRLRHQARMEKTADAVTQAIYDAHDALTATQRKALVDHIRARVQQHHNRRGPAGGTDTTVDHEG